METGQSEIFQERQLQFFLALAEQVLSLRGTAHEKGGLSFLEAERGKHCVGLKITAKSERAPVYKPS